MTELILTKEEKVNFPTLAQYHPTMLGKAVGTLMKQGLTKQQALVNLEMDLAEREQLADG
jgi:hypothetical protein